MPWSIEGRRGSAETQSESRSPVNARKILCKRDSVSSGDRTLVSAIVRRSKLRTFFKERFGHGCKAYGLTANAAASAYIFDVRHLTYRHLAVGYASQLGC
jgi:hypothetical protein